MSMKNVLYMHGGSGNHGCEAIVRTTAQLLGGPKDLVLWSWAKEEDFRYGTAAISKKSWHHSMSIWLCLIT